jgi:hypothetical protein
MEQQSELAGSLASGLPDELLAYMAYEIVASEGKTWPDDRSLFSPEPGSSVPDNAENTGPTLAD